MEFSFNKSTDSVDKILTRLNYLLSGVDYTITITRRKGKRSLAQNRLMWMWFRCIADQTGNSPQDIHDVYCDKFLRIPIMIDNKEQYASQSTSKLNTKEMKDFLDKVQMDAATELGIVLPSPDDNSNEWIYFSEQYGQS